MKTRIYVLLSILFLVMAIPLEREFNVVAGLISLALMLYFFVMTMNSIVEN